MCHIFQEVLLLPIAEIVNRIQNTWYSKSMAFKFEKFVVESVAPEGNFARLALEPEPA
jgi:hypothetical protein